MSIFNKADVHLRLTREQRRAIGRLAKRDRVSVEEAILWAVEQALAARVETTRLPMGTPFHGLDDLLSDLEEGPSDRSTSRPRR